MEKTVEVIADFNELGRTKEWFELAVPNPTIENQCVQVGCHYEEVVEMMFAIQGGNTPLSDTLNCVANAYKEKAYAQMKHCELMSKEEKVALLDALCDQIVTAIGVAHMFGMDISGAMKEVNDSNFSKFVDGKPVFNENGKIKKGPDYRPPQLEQFID
jgi:Phosphoribosyl-ATP pyrophosphohydrolase.